MTWKLVHRSSGDEVQVGDTLETLIGKCIVTGYVVPLMYVDWPCIDVAMDDGTKTVLNADQARCFWIGANMDDRAKALIEELYERLRENGKHGN